MFLRNAFSNTKLLRPTLAPWRRLASTQPSTTNSRRHHIEGEPWIPEADCQSRLDKQQAHSDLRSETLERQLEELQKKVAGLARMTVAPSVPLLRFRVALWLAHDMGVKEKTARLTLEEAAWQVSNRQASTEGDKALVAFLDTAREDDAAPRNRFANPEESTVGLLRALLSTHVALEGLAKVRPLEEAMDVFFARLGDRVHAHMEALAEEEGEWLATEKQEERFPSLARVGGKGW